MHDPGLPTSPLGLPLTEHVHPGGHAVDCMHFNPSAGLAPFFKAEFAEQELPVKGKGGTSVELREWKDGCHGWFSARSKQLCTLRSCKMWQTSFHVLRPGCMTCMTDSMH